MLTAAEQQSPAYDVVVRRTRLARVITEPFAPWMVSLALFLAVALPITAVWKISAHTGVAAAASTVLTIVHGPLVPVLAGPVVALIGWSRVELRHHTTVQVLAGAPTGAVTAAVTFLIAR